MCHLKSLTACFLDHFSWKMLWILVYPAFLKLKFGQDSRFDQKPFVSLSTNCLSCSLYLANSVVVKLCAASQKILKNTGLLSVNLHYQSRVAHFSVQQFLPRSGALRVFTTPAGHPHVIFMFCCHNVNVAVP
jgi:hypothetical protein